MGKYNQRFRQQQFRQQQIDKVNIERQKAGAFEFLQKINYILAKIRETNEGMMQTKPSDNKDKQTIIRVEFPDSGGVLTYFAGLEYPVKGFCHGETVETVDEVKKTLTIFLTDLFDILAKNKVKTILFAILFRKQFESIAKKLIVQLDYRMRRVRQKPERYCLCAREVYRVLSLMAGWYPDHKAEMESFRNIVCMVLEYDDAYRYTFQDIVVEFNEEVGRKNIVREITRLLDLTLYRDSRGLIEKLGRVRKMLFLLRFKKSLREATTRFFLALDMDRIKLDEADLFHAKFKPGYMWDDYKRTCSHKFEKIGGNDATFWLYKCLKCGKLKSNDPTASEEYMKKWEEEIKNDEEKEEEKIQK